MFTEKEQLLSSVMDAMCTHDAGNPLLIHHFVKVQSFAHQIGLAEKLDEKTLFILDIAAYCHDIGILPARKQYGSSAGPLQERLGPPEAEAMLTDLNLDRDVIERVCFLIGHHHTVHDVDAMDWQILLEADYLVNMIEGHASDDAITACKDHMFRTTEGKKLLEWIRPASQDNI